MSRLNGRIHRQFLQLFTPLSRDFPQVLALGLEAAASFTRISGTEITATPPGTLPVGRYRIRVTADGESTVSDGEYACRLGPVVW